MKLWMGPKNVNHGIENLADNSTVLWKKNHLHNSTVAQKYHSLDNCTVYSENNISNKQFFNQQNRFFI